MAERSRASDQPPAPAVRNPWTAFRNPWTNVYGVARSLLAFGTLSALLADPVDVLFRPLGMEVREVPNAVGALDWSLFSLLAGDRLWLAELIAVAVLLAVISGWRPRITGVLHWWVTASFAASAVIVEGGDQVAAVLTLLLLPVTLTDPRRWHWQAAPAITRTSGKVAALVALSCLLVIRLQVAVIYFVSATAKLSVPQWANGTALYYWFTHPVFGFPEAVQPLVVPLLANPWVVTLATWGVLAFEAVLFAGLFMDRRWRPALLKLGLLFHFGIVLVHGLFSFFFAMAAALVLYLWPVDRPFLFPQRAAGWLRKRLPRPVAAARRVSEAES